MGVEEEVLGKAYDARLMRRLLEYVRPYWRQMAIALVAILWPDGIGSAHHLRAAADFTVRQICAQQIDQAVHRIAAALSAEVIDSYAEILSE